jgi:hypothetical protein
MLPPVVLLFLPQLSGGSRRRVRSQACASTRVACCSTSPGTARNHGAWTRLREHAQVLARPRIGGRVPHPIIGSLRAPMSGRRLMQPPVLQGHAARGWGRVTAEHGDSNRQRRRPRRSGRRSAHLENFAASCSHLGGLRPVRGALAQRPPGAREQGVEGAPCGATRQLLMAAAFEPPRLGNEPPRRPGALLRANAFGGAARDHFVNAGGEHVGGRGVSVRALVAARSCRRAWA